MAYRWINPLFIGLEALDRLLFGWLVKITVLQKWRARQWVRNVPIQADWRQCVLRHHHYSGLLDVYVDPDYTWEAQYEHTPIKLQTLYGLGKRLEKTGFVLVDEWTGPIEGLPYLATTWVYKRRPPQRA